MNTFGTLSGSASSTLDWRGNNRVRFFPICNTHSLFGGLEGGRWVDAAAISRMYLWMKKCWGVMKWTDFSTDGCRRRRRHYFEHQNRWGFFQGMLVGAALSGDAARWLFLPILGDRDLWDGWVFGVVTSVKCSNLAQMVAYGTDFKLIFVVDFSKLPQITIQKPLGEVHSR